LNISTLKPVNTAASSFQDDKLNDSTTLEAVPLYLDRDIPHMLERFVQQMEAHEGFVHHCMKRDMSSTSLYPGVGATSLFTRVERNAQILQKRLQRLIKRVGRISTAVIINFLDLGRAADG
jgi:hypothetical protein